jgi:hypothetical protein
MYQSVIGISFSPSQSDSIKRRLLYLGRPSLGKWGKFLTSQSLKESNNNTNFLMKLRWLLQKVQIRICVWPTRHCRPSLRSCSLGCCLGPSSGQSWILLSYFWCLGRRRFRPFPHRSGLLRCLGSSSGHLSCLEESHFSKGLMIKSGSTMNRAPPPPMSKSLTLLQSVLTLMSLGLRLSS